MDASHAHKPDTYPPTLEEALERLAQLSPQAHARTRNHLEGPAARLAPYLTHGMLTVPGVVAELEARAKPRHWDKLVFELAWREYFDHLWSHLGEGIFESRRPPPADDDAYARALPEDVRRASTGIPAIDIAIRTLYGSGYLHNHARMWLASYVVHLRKVDWRVGASWMYGHLVDGDLAANHLSWQWVAGTLTGQPFLFNSGNVARYAPPWASPGTSIDRGYPELRALAGSPDSVPPEPTRPPPVNEPPLSGAPALVSAVESLDLAGRHVHLVHPWALGPTPEGAVNIGVLHADFHDRFPWSHLRWHFVLRRMLTACDTLYAGDVASLRPLLAEASDVSVTATRHAGYLEALSSVATRISDSPRLFPNPSTPARSFSHYWAAVQGGEIGPEDGRDSAPPG